MLDKKGFTIIELLAVLVIMASASIVIVLNMQGIESGVNKDLKATSVKEIEEAACSFVDKINFDLDGNGKDRDYCVETNNCNIYLSTLISQGYIDEDSKFDDEGHYYKDYEDVIYVEVRWITDENYKVKTCTCKLNGDDCL